MSVLTCSMQLCLLWVCWTPWLLSRHLAHWTGDSRSACTTSEPPQTARLVQLIHPILGLWQPICAIRDRQSYSTWLMGCILPGGSQVVQACSAWLRILTIKILNGPCLGMASDESKEGCLLTNVLPSSLVPHLLFFILQQEEAFITVLLQGKDFLHELPLLNFIMGHQFFVLLLKMVHHLILLLGQCQAQSLLVWVE